MAKYLVAKHEDLIGEFNEQGLSCVEVCPGASPYMKTYKCVLKAGTSWKPELFAYGDTTQFFAFITATGFIDNGKQSWNITDYAAFIPNYDVDPITIHSGEKDLEFYRFIGKMHPKFDVWEMDYMMLVLPYFKLFKDGMRYTEGFTGGIGSSCRSHSVIEHRLMGRYSMGWNVGEGPSVIGQHIHADLDQWYFILPGGVMTYEAGGEATHVTAGDVTYTEMGMAHGSTIAENEMFNYFWVETAVEGYKERDPETT